jgi:betaine lipid synthase
MDSMDWFDPAEKMAVSQVKALNRALQMGGRVLLRSASINPWYVQVFKAQGFSTRCVGARLPGACIDR